MKKEAYVTELFNISDTERRNFVNIRVGEDKDTTLFINSTSISIFKSESEYIERMYNRLDNYFNVLREKLLVLHNQGSSYNRQLEEVISSLSEHSSEVSELHLGFSRESNKKGKGCSTDSYAEILKQLSTDILKNINQLDSLKVYVDNLGQDRISDIISNIVLDVLCEFTIEECKKYNYTNVKKVDKTMYYYSEESSKFELFNPKLPHYNEKPFILVPNLIVQRNDILSADKFFNRYVVKETQNELQEKQDREFESVQDGGKPRIITMKEAEEHLVEKSKDRGDDVDDYRYKVRYNVDYIDRKPESLAEFEKFVVSNPNSEFIEEDDINFKKLVEYEQEVND